MANSTMLVTIFVTNACAEAFASASAFDANVVIGVATAAQARVAAVRAELAILTLSTAAIELG